MVMFRGIGALVGAASGVCYAACALFGKLLKKDINPIVIGWSCCLAAVIITVPVIAIKRIRVWSYPRTDQMVMFLIGLTTASFQIAQYYAFQKANLSDAITLSATSPLFLIFFNCIFRREPCRFLDIFVVFSCLLGVVLCAQPTFLFHTGKTFSANRMIGYSLSIIVAFCWALFFILMERLREVHPIAASFMANVYGLIFTSIVLAASNTFKLPQDYRVTSYLSGLIILNLFASATSYISVILDNPLMASIGKTSDIAVSILIDYVVFKVTSNYVSIIGSFLIMMGIVLPSIINLYVSKYDALESVNSND